MNDEELYSLGGMTNSSPAMFDRRRRILCAVRDLIRERGLDGFNIRELCRRAEVAQRTVYNAFGSKENTIKRLSAGASNKSDLGGVLQTNNIHILTCDAGAVTKTLRILRDSSATAKGKAKFILATDGVEFEAEDLTGGGTIACAYKDFPDHFGFFLPLACITTFR